ALIHVIMQGCDARRLLVKLFGKLCSSFAHTHALKSRQRTGVITAFMPASMNLGGDLYPKVTADKQGADPFWSIHLVRRQRQQIYRLLLHIEQDRKSVV